MSCIVVGTKGNFTNGEGNDIMEIDETGQWISINNTLIAGKC